MTKKQKDAAFIEKCKTIGISTGAKEDEHCVFCGEPGPTHVPQVSIVVEKVRHDEAEEESFAA